MPEGRSIGEAFITVRFTKGDTSEISRAAESELGQAGGKAGEAFSKGWAQKAGAIGSQLTRQVTLPILAGFAVAFHEANESIKVGAQTEAVIKSTGGAANVSKSQIEGLANALSRKAGIDDENIQSGENLLLTFRDVRNEAGRGNDVFNQTTKLALDMSVAMGTDLNGSVLQVGKALQDPINGLTALRRVGVQFTDQQKEQIKTLVESGDKLGAQKIILKELAQEFGGSAAAAATPLDKLEVKLLNTAENLGTKLMPALEAGGEAVGFFADSFNDLPDIAQYFVVGGLAIAAMAGPVLKIIGNVSELRTKIDGLGTAGAKINTALGFGGAVLGIGALVFGAVELGKQMGLVSDNVEALRKHIDALSKTKTSDLVGEFNKLATSAGSIEDPIAQAAFGVDHAKESLKLFREIAEQSPGTAQRLITAMDGSGQSTGRYQAILDRTVSSQKQANSDQQRGAELTRNQAEGFDAATNAAEAFKQALDDVSGATRGQEAAQIAYDNSLAQLNASIFSNTVTFAENTQEGRNNRQAVLDSTNAALALAQAQVQQSGDTQGATLTLQGHAAQLAAVMAQSGMTQGQIQSYLFTLGLTPQQIATTVNAATETASGKINSIKDLLNSLDGRQVTATVVANIIANKTGSPFGAYGLIYGPGGKRFAQGGTNREAMAVHGVPGGITWAEPETGVESYIPWATDRRPRALSILEQTANAFGRRTVKMAEGGAYGAETPSNGVFDKIRAPGGVDLSGSQFVALDARTLAREVAREVAFASRTPGV